MFGFKKKEKVVKTYVDGKEVGSDKQVGELPVPKPADAPPAQVVKQQPVEFQGDCLICFDYGYYADHVGVWHECPRCGKKKPEQAVADRPKNPLFVFKNCKDCGERNEVHRQKKVWQCGKCGVQQ
jgi:ribosomal protein L37AE/L43A